MMSIQFTVLGSCFNLISDIVLLVTIFLSIAITVMIDFTTTILFAAV